MKKGDKVRIVNNGVLTSVQKPKLGQVGTIIDDDYETPNVQFDDGVIQCFHMNELEPVSNSLEKRVEQLEKRVKQLENKLLGL